MDARFLPFYLKVLKMTEKEAPLTEDEIHRLNMNNLSVLIKSVFPNSVMLLAVIPDPNGHGLYTSSNVQAADHKFFLEAISNLTFTAAQTLNENCSAGRTIN